jgi:hypothetical protein
MAGLAHLGLGFAAKRLVPKVPLPVLLVVALGSDLLYIIFMLLGMGHLEAVGWLTHGMVMCAVGSVLTGLIAAMISRSLRTSLVLGFLFFSHWLLDFIVWPMTAVIKDATRMPLFFGGSPRVGLGLYRSLPVVIIMESGIIAAGVIIYIFTLRKMRREKYFPVQELKR